ncbi:MAG: ATP-binding cassette domain-containing protein [Betaproteobacteria bacterium]|nr:ATP-binding cassette domain-containing protein [Betaproteobacteria bacterium]
MHSPEPARLSLSNITKRYPGVVANRSVSLSVRPGEAHAVLGENGAGKSTLMKIIYGSVKPDEGEIQYNGQVVHIRNPQQARALGISMVFQHFSLFDTLSVAENVWLGLDKSLKLAEVTSRISLKAAEAGQVTGVCDPREESNASLSRLMIGAEPPALTYQDRQPGAVLFEVKNLSLPKEDQFGVDLSQVSLQVRAGEVVGIAGVSGNGQRELLYALSGEDTRAQAQAVQLLGQAVGQSGPDQRRQAGLHFVPEERLGRGAVPSLSLAQNMLLTRSEAMSQSGWIHTPVLQTQAQKIIDRFNVKANGTQAAAKSLSGGNLQKFIVGREIDANPRVLLVSQPTWGVDVGAAAQIRSELLALRDAGCAVLVVSEELDELFEISDRLYVMANGKLSPSIDRKDATVAQIGEWMSGLWEAHAQA